MEFEELGSRQLMNSTMHREERRLSSPACRMPDRKWISINALPPKTKLAFPTASRLSLS